MVLLHLFECVSDVVTIGINDLFQSFGPVGGNTGDYLNCESAQNCFHNLEKLIDLGNRSGSELVSQLTKEKKVQRCNIRAERRMRNAFEV
jgi:hypothetical protein